MKKRKNIFLTLFLNVAKSVFVMLVGMVAGIVCIFSPSSASELLVGLSVVILDDETDLPQSPNDAIQVGR